MRGRRILTPGDMIRPTQEKVRQALFSCIAARIPGCRFLDLFAGTGAVGLEAWSRGADFVCWVERDPRVAAILKRNVGSLCVPSEDAEGQFAASGKTRVVTADAVSFIRKAANEGPFDVIFADPPYATGRGESWPRNILQSVTAGSTLAPGGVLVIEQGADEPSPGCEGWNRVSEKVYGGTRLRFWER